VDYSFKFISYHTGWTYPIPQSTKSPQIASYQTGLQQFSNRIFHNATALAQWYEDVMGQALLINMHEYFSGQIIFELHPVCDAMFYIQNSSTAVPLQMRQVEKNISFLEYSSPSHLENPSLNDRYTTNPSTVYVTKNNWLSTLPNLPANSIIILWTSQVIQPSYGSLVLITKLQLINQFKCWGSLFGISAISPTPSQIYSFLWS